MWQIHNFLALKIKLLFRSNIWSLFHYLIIIKDWQKRYNHIFVSQTNSLMAYSTFSWFFCSFKFGKLHTCCLPKFWVDSEKLARLVTFIFFVFLSWNYHQQLIILSDKGVVPLLFFMSYLIDTPWMLPGLF